VKIERIEKIEFTPGEACRFMGTVVFACMTLGFLLGQKGVKPEALEKPPIVAPDNKAAPLEAKNKENPPPPAPQPKVEPPATAPGAPAPPASAPGLP
jgi:hypothetical protein